MTINLQYVNTQTDARATSILYKKLENLGNKFSWLIHAEVFFKEEKNTVGKGKICEIKLSLPGPYIYASSNESSFEAALAETIRDLERQLSIRKEKWEPQNYSNN